MPWSNDNVPDQVKGLPAEAKEVWITIANAALKTYPGDDERAIKTAWTGLKNAGWSKDDSGTWTKTTKASDQVDLKEVERVEVFEAGTYRGTPYGTDFLDRLVLNFERLKGVLKPPVKLGHEDHQSLLEKEGLPAAGYVTALRRVGRKLIADLSDVPEKVYKLLQKRSYTRVSSEIRPNFTHEGTRYGPTFWGLALLGADVPQVKTLDDILALTDEDDSPSLCFGVGAKEGGLDMSDKQFTQDDLDRRLKEQEDTLTAKFADTEKGLKADAEAKGKALEDRNAADRKTKVEAFSERLAEAKVRPVFTTDLGLDKFLEGLDGADVVQFADGDDGKATSLDFAIAFTEKIVQAAKDEKLFVDDSEHAPGDDGREDFEHGEDGLTSEQAKTAERMVKTQVKEKIDL